MTRAAAPYLDAQLEASLEAEGRTRSERRRSRAPAPPAGGFYVELRRRAARPRETPILRLVHPQSPAGRGHAARARFEALRARWKSETRFESSSTKLFLHPAYQQIIGMGADALPLILDALSAEPDHWSWALKAITGEDPVPPEARGNLRRMAEAWLDWARRAGLHGP